MISATMGVGSLVLAGFADPAKFASIWLMWWLGDDGGQMLVTPFIVLWSKTSLKEMRQSCSAWPCCWGYDRHRTSARGHLSTRGKGAEVRLQAPCGKNRGKL